MHSNLWLRIVSAVIMGPLVLCPILFGKSVYDHYNIPLYPMLLSIFGMGLAWEWGSMFQKKSSINQLIISLIATMVAFMVKGNSDIPEGNPEFCLWLILFGTACVLAVSHHIKFALGLPYICLPILSLGYIYIQSYEIVLWLLFVVWATDIGGFVVGKTVGGPKLAPKISAKKTWSGLIGAILFAMGVAWVFSLYLKAEQNLGNMKTVLVVSAGFLAVISQIGDFFESAIKRKLGLKDSSNLIPGHGGLFDRVDGLLFASVATALVLYFFN